jgi:predicted metal-dependent phosphoesterase TrpH
MAGLYVDLHTHSFASDGSDSPGELVRKAAVLGLAAVALTDHDTLAGLDEAREEAARVGIDCVPGIEIAVQGEHDEVHLVGLWMPSPSRRMRDALEVMQQNRQARNQAMLDVLSGMGMPMSMEEVRAQSGGVAVGRQHIARTMRDKGYVSSSREAFDRYIGRRGKAYVPRVLLTPEQGIGLLRDEGATVALAHPFLSRMMTPERLDDTLSDFHARGLTAIEAYYSPCAPEQVRFCVELAAKHHLLLTGGSDYHGVNKEGISLGTGTGSLRIPVVLLEKMREYRKKAGLRVE